MLASRETRIVTGNYSAAWGAKLCRPELIAAYPITPQTLIVEHLADFVNEGSLDAEYMRVESEHSAMSACIAAEGAGVRTFTATSSQGLALMHETLYVASGVHLPVVMAVVNRSLSSPLGIWAEHNDTMPERDAGWLQMYVENNQEILDMIIQAYSIAEHREVRLPLMVCLDGFILSHTMEPVELPNQSEVDEFLPAYDSSFAHMSPEDPMIVGTASPPDYIMESRYQTDASMLNARRIIAEVDASFAKRFGRSYHGLLEEYMTEDAETVLVTLGTITSTARDVVNELRSQGQRVGLVKLRFFRPFPVEELRSLSSRTGAIGFCDRAVSYGHGGPTYIEGKSALYGHSNIPILSFLTGLGGRDVTRDDIHIMFKILLAAARRGTADREIHWINTRGVEP